jgi:hypothetical protein
MKLLTEELIARFKMVGSQEEKKKKICIAHFFNPYGIGNWFATEYYPDDETFFGYVSLFGDYNDEWGYFGLAELKDNQIERDMWFKECFMDTIIKKYTK